MGDMRAYKDMVRYDVRLEGSVSAMIKAPFDLDLELLREERCRFISLQENARLRIQEGKYAHISGAGNRVREGVIYVRNKGAFLTKRSPVLDDPERATQINQKRRGYKITPDQVESGLAESVHLTKKPILTRCFAEDPITVFAFGDIAGPYGEFLQEAGIKEMPIRLAKTEDEPFATQMWFAGLNYRSALDGGDRDLTQDNIDWVRGIREEQCGQSTTLDQTVYSRERISASLQRIGLPGVEEILMKDLRKDE